MHNVAKVALPFWLNNYVEMVEQENVSQHSKGMQFFDVTKNFAQQVHIPWVTENGSSVLHDLRDKNRRARNIITAKVHGQIIQWYMYVGHAFSMTIAKTSRYKRDLQDISEMSGLIIIQAHNQKG